MRDGALIVADNADSSPEYLAASDPPRTAICQFPSATMSSCRCDWEGLPRAMAPRPRANPVFQRPRRAQVGSLRPPGHCLNSRYILNHRKAPNDVTSFRNDRTCCAPRPPRNQNAAAAGPRRAAHHAKDGSHRCRRR